MNKPAEEPAAAKPSFPATKDDISIEWLDTVVPGAAEAGGIKSFEVEPVGQGVDTCFRELYLVCLGPCFEVEATAVEDTTEARAVQQAGKASAAFAGDVDSL